MPYVILQSGTECSPENYNKDAIYFLQSASANKRLLKCKDGLVGIIEKEVIIFYDVESLKSKKLFKKPLPNAGRLYRVLSDIASNPSTYTYVFGILFTGSQLYTDANKNNENAKLITGVVGSIIATCFMSLNLYNKYFVSDKNPQNNISSILSIYEMPDMEDKNENITLVLENLLDKGNESYLSFVDSEYEHKKTRTRSLISKNSNKLDI